MFSEIQPNQFGMNIQNYQNKKSMKKHLEKT